MSHTLHSWGVATFPIWWVATFPIWWSHVCASFAPLWPCLDMQLFPVRNPGGKKAPQDSVHPTAQHKRIEETEELLTKAKNRSQSALKDLASSTVDASLDIRLRSVVGHAVRWQLLFVHGTILLPSNRVVAHCAHIIPFSIHSNVTLSLGCRFHYLYISLDTNIYCD